MKHIILAAIVFTLVLTPLVLSEVVVFDKYNTGVEFDEGKLIVTKELRLKNTGENPIIPGEIHFKISKEDGGDMVAPDVSSLTVTDKFGKQLESRQVASDDEVDLVFTVWDPLLPNFFYDMTMVYELDIKPKGILFYQIALPEERTTIPIRNSKTQFIIPKKYSITYAPNAEVTSENGKNIASWEVKDSYRVEYSVVPLPKLPVRGANVFWILIILIFLVILIMRLRKRTQLAY